MVPEPEKALFHQGLIQKQCFQPLIVPGAFQEVQVADVLRAKDILPSVGWPGSGSRLPACPSQACLGPPPGSCPSQRRSLYPPQTQDARLPCILLYPKPACGQAHSSLLTFPRGACRKPRLPRMRSDWVREKAVKP